MKVIFYYICSSFHLSHASPSTASRHNSKNCTLQRKHSHSPVLLVFCFSSSPFSFHRSFLQTVQLRYCERYFWNVQRLRKESRPRSHGAFQGLKIRFPRVNELTKSRCIDSGNSGWTMYSRIDTECRGRRITDQVNGRSAGSHLRGILRQFSRWFSNNPSKEFELGVYDYFIFALIYLSVVHTGWSLQWKLL